MSFRPASRIFSTLRPTFRQQLLFRPRRIHTGPNPAVDAAEARSGFAKIWHSPVGPKTVHFWAPIMKWALVLAGVSDFARPADQLSLTQNFALMCTGAIWTRWCFIIKPKNMFLAAVNFFLFLVGSTQVTRILLHQQSVKDAVHNAEAEVKVESAELKKELQAGVEKAKQIVKH